jgi:hypothetical protein
MERFKSPKDDRLTDMPWLGRPNSTFSQNYFYIVSREGLLGKNGVKSPKEETGHKTRFLGDLSARLTQPHGIPSERFSLTKMTTKAFPNLT